MGLDMYLESMPKIEGLTFEKQIELNDKLQTGTISEEEMELVKPYVEERGKEFTWKTIRREEAYWRKANAIHLFFVENVQGGVDECKPHRVRKDNLEELLDYCQEVLDDHSMAEELLPTQHGFFFGSTEYDEYYFNKLKHTVEMVERILDELDFENNYLIYQSSW